MRRGAPSPMLRVGPAAVPACGRVAVTSRGLEIEPIAAPAGATLAAPTLRRLVYGAPFPADQAVIVARGTLAVTLASSVARSVRLPKLEVAFDRRPPGLTRVAGAALANAAALVRDDGWSAVVLPSLGNIGEGDGGGGQVSLRHDGLMAAAAHGDRVTVHDLAAEGATVATHEGAYSAVAFDADGELVVGVGAGVRRVGGAQVEGSPVVQIATAAAAPRALARHADGTLSLWDVPSGAKLSTWSSPVQGPAHIGLSASGEFASIGTPWAEPPAAALHVADGGAIELYVEGAKSIGPSPVDDGILITGAWGMAWIAPVEDAS